jgi:outer membrane protein assembly factor BamB
MWTRLQQLFNVAGSAATGGSPFSICTDGEQIYYICGSIGQVMIAASPVDGAEVWEASGGLTQPSAICADGNYLYANDTNAGQPGLRKLDRDTGTAVSSGGTEYSCDVLRTNGVYAVGISPFSSSSKLVFWTVGAGAAAPTETGTQTITPLNGLAIDADSVYVGGTRSTYDVWAWDLAARTNNWQITLPVTTAPTVAAITADGDCVYVATERKTLSAGGSASVFCLDRVNGSLLWTYDIPATTDAAELAVDDRYLYVRDSDDDLHMLRLRFPEPTLVAIAADWNEVQCDGVSVIGTDATTTTNFMRHMVGGPSKTYMRAEGDDPTRRPMPGLLAVPTGEI